MDWGAVRRYLIDIKGTTWFDRLNPEHRNRVGNPMRDWTRDIDALGEFAGRLCYRSWEPGLNANVTRVREDSAEYHRNTLSSGHGAIYEHASITFLFQDVSRVFTHELVRHRAGVAISQE